jgi:hypothetical protein
MNTGNDLGTTAKELLRHLPESTMVGRARPTREYSIAALGIVALSIGTVWFQLSPMVGRNPGVVMVLLWSVLASGTVIGAALNQLRSTRVAYEADAKRVDFARHVIELESSLILNASRNVSADWENNPSGTFVRISEDLRSSSAERLEAKILTIPFPVKIVSSSGEEVFATAGQEDDQ